MKNLFKWLALCGIGVIVVFFGARNCAGPRNPLAFVDVDATNVTVLSEQSHAWLKSDEDFLVLQATPAQFASLVKQFKSQPKTNEIYHGVRRIHAPEVKAFFAAAPASAQNGSFIIERNNDEEHPWDISCDYTADEQTGRIYLYALSVYN